METSCDNRFRTGPFSCSLGNKCVGYSSSTSLLALPTLPKSKLPLGQAPSKSQQQDGENRGEEHRTQKDQLLGGGCWKPFPPSRGKKNPKSSNSKEKRREKVLLFFRATHASTLQSLACVSISEVNSIFFRWKRFKKKREKLRIQPSENCFGRSHAISHRRKKKKNQLFLIYLLIHLSISFLSNVKMDVFYNFASR